MKRFLILALFLIVFNANFAVKCDGDSLMPTIDSHTLELSNANNSSTPSPKVLPLFLTLTGLSVLTLKRKSSFDPHIKQGE